MARRPRTVKASPWWRLVLVPLPFLIALPFLVKPAFSLIDDGVSLDIARRMDTNEMRENPETGQPYSSFWYVESDMGRVRPAYWWWMWLNYKLYGTGAGGWYFGLALSLAVLLQIVYQIAHRATGSVLASVIAGGLVAAFYPYSDVFTRLGLGETPQLLLLGVSMLCMVEVYALGPKIAKRDVPFAIALFAAASVVAGIAYFVKETTIAMAPASIVMALALWRRKADGLSKGLLLGYAAVNVAAAAVLTAYVAPLLGSGEYSALYFFQSRTDWGTARRLGTTFALFFDYLGRVRDAWLALPVIGLASLVFRLVRSWRGDGLTDSQRWQLAWLTFAVVCLVLLAPWGGSDRVAARYLLPVTLFGALAIGPEIAWLVTGSRRALADTAKAGAKLEAPRVLLRAWWVGLVALLGVVGVLNVVLACVESGKAHKRLAADANMVRLIASEAPHGKPLFMKLVILHEEEIRYEVMLHLRLIHGRDDYNYHTVKYVGDPDYLSLPEGYKTLVGQPDVGEWLVYPWGRYRENLAREMERDYGMLKPTRLYTVTSRGWQLQSDPRTIFPTMDEAGYGWIVFVSGVDLSAPTSPEGGP